MKSKIAFIFPGQGAQYIGMGKEFYETSTIVRETFEEASELLKKDFCRLIFKGTQEELKLTCNSQPAIFITSVAILRYLTHHFPSFTPLVCSGLSLGEYTALYAGNFVSFEEALKLVNARGQFMQEASEKAKSEMAVVLGLDPNTIQSVLPKHSWLANLNCPGQTVIAGLSSVMQEAKQKLLNQGAKRIIPLDVIGAFHTPLMASAQIQLTPYINSVVLQDSFIKLVMNVTGKLEESLTALRRNLILKLTSPVQWEKGIQTIEQLGVSLFIEIGPGKSLSGINKKIGVSGSTLNIEKPIDLEPLEKYCYAAQR